MAQRTFLLCMASAACLSVGILALGLGGPIVIAVAGLVAGLFYARLAVRSDR